MCFSFIKRFYFDRLTITYPKGIGTGDSKGKRVHNNEPIQGMPFTIILKKWNFRLLIQMTNKETIKWIGRLLVFCFLPHYTFSQLADCRSFFLSAPFLVEIPSLRSSIYCWHSRKRCWSMCIFGVYSSKTKMVFLKEKYLLNCICI
jgi:hypothetical protein